MICRILGNTNDRLPEVGLGTWNYTGGVEPLKRGIALGACLIDTAESYGTEEIVGEAVKGVRQCVFLATKVSPRHFSTGICYWLQTEASNDCGLIISTCTSCIGLTT